MLKTNQPSPSKTTTTKNARYYIVSAAKTISLCFLLTSSFSACSSMSQRGKGQADLGFSEEQLALMEQERWGDGSIPAAMQDGAFQDIHFDYDSTQLPEDRRQQVQKNADVLSADKALRVEVEGHCDKRGTSEYNLVLGEERARTISNLLLSFGASPEQVKIVSYGEEIPLDPAENDEAFKLNRRVHFAVYREKAATR